MNAALVFPDADEVAARCRSRKRGIVHLSFNPDALPPATRRTLEAHAAATGRTIEEVAAEALMSGSQSLARKGGTPR